MNRLIGQAAQQYQPKDRERFIQYVQQDPMAAAQLRAPLYEDKVVDFLFSKAEISERTVDRAELEADLESEEGHVHGPDCGHDHGDAKPAKKAAAKKPAAKARPKPPVGKRKADGQAQAGQAGQGRRRGRRPRRAAKPSLPAKKAPAKKAPAKAK